MARFVFLPAPLSAGAQCVQALRLFRSSFGDALPYAMLGSLLFWLITAAAWTLRVSDQHLGPLALSLAAADVLMLPAMMSACLYSIDGHAHQLPLKFMEPLARAAACCIPCLLATVVHLALVAAGGALLVLPGLFLFVHAGFWWPRIVQGQAGPLAALGYSAALTRRNWWRASLYLAMGAAPLAISAWLGAHAAAQNADRWPSPGALALGLGALAVLQMLFCSCMVVGYRDLQLRQRALAG